MARDTANPWACRCGARFRSATAEATHRHNFPLLCRAAKASSQPNNKEGWFGDLKYLSATRSAHYQRHPTCRVGRPGRVAPVHTAVDVAVWDRQTGQPARFHVVVFGWGKEALGEGGWPLRAALGPAAVYHVCSPFGTVERPCWPLPPVGAAEGEGAP